MLDPEKTTVAYQTEWFEAFSLIDMIRLSQKFTVAQMLSHDTFARRLDEGLVLAMHELLYPMLMAYDSVAIDADVELGGMEQRFNILQGRNLQRADGQRPQIAVLMPMLPGVDGGVKMGKSLGNYIGVNDEPADMFGKIMSVQDDVIVQYFTLAAGVPPDTVARAEASLRDPGVNPRDVKRELGRAVVTRYHGAEAASKADEAFMGVFSRRDQLPDDMPEVTIPSGAIGIVELIDAADLAQSRSDARRLVEQGGVSIDGDKVMDPNAEVEPEAGAVLRVGKRRFARIVVQ